ncbi:MAG TPA: hypothetical protein VK590_08880 [Saprospiraceae bacterium]|nr:hypothetical protein [Saprospiraceae bacterium]
MEIQLKIIGLLLIGLSILHIIFPKYFNWKEELFSLSLINRQMMYVHMFFIALVVFMMGIMCLWLTNDLLNTPLGKLICLGIGIFWMIRLYVQVFVYEAILWKSKQFETGIHIVFIMAWTYFSLIFFMIYFKS